MYIHKQFLKEHITDDSAVKDLAFFLYVKRLFPNSIIYNSMSFERLGRIVGMSRKTAAKHFKALISRGWIKKVGNHYCLVSIEKTFMYRQKENGKADKKWRCKYFRIFLKDKYNYKDYIHLLRGLLMKSFYQKSLYAQNNLKGEQNIKKKKAIMVLSTCLGDKPRIGAESLRVKAGINFIGKMMRCSKSTAQRTITKLEEMRLLIKTPGEYKYRGRAENLIVSELPYGIFKTSGLVYQKQINSYVI